MRFSLKQSRISFPVFNEQVLFVPGVYVVYILSGHPAREDIVCPKLRDFGEWQGYSL
jgi:hypothetical protein